MSRPRWASSSVLVKQWRMPPRPVGASAASSDAEAIGPGIAAMDDDGQFRGACERHLVAEDLLLHFARRVIVEIVEADFAPGDYFRMLRERERVRPDAAA